jgi:hypothetical protein
MVIRFRKNSQITLPASIAGQLHLKEGDFLDCQCNGRYVNLVPLKMVPKYDSNCEAPFFNPTSFRKVSVMCFGGFNLMIDGQAVHLKKKSKGINRVSGV